jgi:hypothetical protein
VYHEYHMEQSSEWQVSSKRSRLQIFFQVQGWAHTVTRHGSLKVALVTSIALPS